MYYIYGISGPSLLIESTDSMIPALILLQIMSSIATNDVSINNIILACISGILEICSCRSPFEYNNYPRFILATQYILLILNL